VHGALASSLLSQSLLELVGDFPARRNERVHARTMSHRLIQLKQEPAGPGRHRAKSAGKRSTFTYTLSAKWHWTASRLLATRRLS
jgi:hypothetical protein